MRSKPSWKVKVQTDPKTKDLFIELPAGLLEQVGWKEGDDVLWTQKRNGWELIKTTKK
jgi:hypothetical protein